MPQDTVSLAFELELPLTVVHELVKRHLLRTLLKSTNGHSPASGNGQILHADEKELEAPLLPSSSGAP